MQRINPDNRYPWQITKGIFFAAVSGTPNRQIGLGGERPAA